MRLYLAQHGEAVDKQDDPQRPLSEAGTADVQAMAACLAQAGIRVARSWHSGKLRAQQTADLLAAAVQPGGAAQAVEGIAPRDPVDEFILDSDVWEDDTLVVGHLPFMGRLVARLLVHDEAVEPVAFTPGTIVCLERRAPDHWVLCWMLGPKLLTREST